MCEKLKNLKKTEYEIALLLSEKGILNANDLQSMLNVDKATIYRNLKTLLKKKIIREILTDEKTFMKLTAIFIIPFIRILNVLNVKKYSA